MSSIAESSSLVLAADIGGTHSRFAIFDLSEEPPQQLATAWLQTCEANQF